MVKNFKLVILGPENSGKSALVTQFLDNRFVEDYEPTKISYARKSFGVLGQKVLLDFEEFGQHARAKSKQKPVEVCVITKVAKVAMRAP